MAHPEMWMKSAGLEKRPLLPVLGGGSMSLEEAKRRGRNGELWMSRGQTSLARLAKKKGAVVLNAENESWRKVILRLPGISDLDEIAALSPIRAEEAPKELVQLRRLVEGMNSVLGRCGLKRLTIRITFARSDFVARDVDLTSLGLKSRYIVIPAGSPLLSRCAMSLSSTPTLAIFTALYRLTESSSMLRQHRDAILPEAARATFGDA